MLGLSRPDGYLLMLGEVPVRVVLPRGSDVPELGIPPDPQSLGADLTPEVPSPVRVVTEAVPTGNRPKSAISRSE